MYKLYFFLLCAMLCTSCSKKYNGRQNAVYKNPGG